MARNPDLRRLRQQVRSQGGPVIRRGVVVVNEGRRPQQPIRSQGDPGARARPVAAPEPAIGQGGLSLWLLCAGGGLAVGLLLFLLWPVVLWVLKALLFAFWAGAALVVMAAVGRFLSLFFR
jgi:hypothetical protein